jgi:sugar phosphate isomerase/epimerase
MSAFKIGVLAEGFRLPIREGIAKAAELGAEGVQVYAVRGETAPEAMDSDARKSFYEYVSGLGLEISALCGDLGGHGFRRADENEAKIARSKEIVDLAVDLGTDVVTTHIGAVPEDVEGETYATMRKACRELGDYAATKGVSFAIETGPETAVRLKAFLDAVGSPGIGVNLDPANLVMVVADDPVAAAKILGPHIVHTHAKDGRQFQPCDPEEVYGAFATGGFAALEERMGRLFEEVPLGTGSVDWDAYLAALTEAEYSGFLTIERETGADPAADIATAIQFLKGKIA